MLFIVCMALPARSQQYLLYTPQPAPSGQKVSVDEGILVQEIEIKKGDTLYGLSRKFSGKGMYYPQILLFNSIKNPNLIYSGKKLRIPLLPDNTQTVTQHVEPPPTSQPHTELSPRALKKSKTDREETRRLKKKGAISVKQGSSPKPPAALAHPVQLPAADKNAASAPPPVAPASAGQKLFEAAVKSYRQDDCRTALELFDRYLADNPGSAQAAEANLFKADCYLKLSTQ